MASALELLHTGAGWALRTSLHATVLVVLVLAVQALLGARLRPGWRHALWLVVLVRLVLPAAPESSLSLFNFLPQSGVLSQREAMPAASAPTAAPQLPGHTEAPPVASGAPSQAPVPVPSPTPQALEIRDAAALLWAAGALTVLLVVLLRLARCHWRLRAWPLLADARAMAVLRACAREMGVRRGVRLQAAGAGHSPALLGHFRPRLLLSASLAREMNAAQLRHVFLHELAHLKRRDILLNWCATALLALHWFNPVLWYAFRRMRADQELACDALALRHLDGAERHAYGNTLLHLLAGRHTQAFPAGTAAIFESKHHLKRRLAMIATADARSRWTLLPLLLFPVLCAVGLTSAKAVEEHAPEPEIISYIGRPDSADSLPASSTIPRTSAAYLIHLKSGLQQQADHFTEAGEEITVSWNGHTHALRKEFVERIEVVVPGIGAPEPPVPLHVVQPGESLEDIAKESGLTPRELARFNGLSENAAPLAPGLLLRVPSPAEAIEVAALPLLEAAAREELGLGKVLINMLRGVSESRPLGQAIINLDRVFIGEVLPGTRARLIAIDERTNSIGIEMLDSGARYRFTN